MLALAAATSASAASLSAFTFMLRAWYMESSDTVAISLRPVSRMRSW